jgi:formate hydrogenlyase transcriptional activator
MAGSVPIKHQASQENSLSTQKEASSAEAIAKRYEALLQLSRTLSAQTPDDLAGILATQLRSVLDFDFLDVLVYKGDESREVEWHISDSGPVHLLSEIDPEDSADRWVHQHQQLLAISDWSCDTRFSKIRSVLERHGIVVRSVCRIPLTTPRRKLGVFGIAARLPHVFSDEELHFLRLIADGIALSLESALSFEALHRSQEETGRQKEKLEFLLRLTTRVTSSFDLRELLRIIAASIREVVRCDRAGILLKEPQSDQLRVYALGIPDQNGLFREDQVLPRSGSAAKALESLEPVIDNNVDPSIYGLDSSRLPPDERVRSACLIPLVNQGRALGLLGVARHAGDEPFSGEEATFLFQMAGQLAIAIENALAWCEISALKDKIAQEKLYLEDEIRSELHFGQIIGNSAGLKHVLAMVSTVASSDSTVLLLGETGTGKELIARAIHENSRRSTRTFVKLNCAAIPTGLLESELFGHEKGAFTGAISQKVGRLELADQGTLFLDEVGDIPIEIQPKLLRALQEREFERLGSTHTRRVNVRLIAATNRDLESMIEAREFRSDLYYRLNVFPIRIPPLRERKEDIPTLVRYFTQKYAGRMQKSIESVPSAALRMLTAWEWPGNIRELENFIERAVILTRGRTLEVPLAELTRSRSGSPHRDSAPVQREEIARIVRETLNEIQHGAPPATLAEFDERQREEIVRVLAETRGRVGGLDGAAARMSLKRTTLLSRMKKLGIHPREFA